MPPTKKPQLEIGFDPQVLKNVAAQSARVFTDGWGISLESDKGKSVYKGLEKIFVEGYGKLGRSSQPLERAYGKFQKKMASKISSKFGREFGQVMSRDIGDALTKSLGEGALQQLESKRVRGKTISEMLTEVFTPDAKKLARAANAAGSVLVRSITNQLGPLAPLGNLGSNIRGGGMLGGTMLTAAQIGGSFLSRTGGFLKSEERYLQRLAPLSDRGARGAYSIIGEGRRTGFGREEAAALGVPLARVGAETGARAMFRAERGFGMGSDVTAMLGAQAYRGAHITRERSLRDLRMVFATAMSTSLERGRWGELARGLAHMTTSRGLGQSLNKDEMFKGLMSLGDRFRGTQGFEAARGMERLMTNPKSGAGQFFAMMAAGYGKEGTGYFKARRMQELGIFGEGYDPNTGGTRTGIGMKGLRGILSKYASLVGLGEGLVEKGSETNLGKEMTGKEEELRGLMLEKLKAETGIKATTWEQILDELSKGDRASEKKIKEYYEAGQDLETRAYKTMIGLAPLKNLGDRLDDTMSKFIKEFRPVLEKLIAALNKLIDVLPGVFKKTRQFAETLKETYDVGGQAVSKFSGELLHKRINDPEAKGALLDKGVRERSPQLFATNLLTSALGRPLKAGESVNELLKDIPVKFSKSTEALIREAFSGGRGKTTIDQSELIDAMRQLTVELRIGNTRPTTERGGVAYTLGSGS